VREDDVEEHQDSATRTGTVIEPDFVSRSLRHQLLSANKLVELNRSQATAYSNALDRRLEEIDDVRHRFAKRLVQLRFSQRAEVELVQNLASSQKENASLQEEIAGLRITMRDQEVFIERISNERDTAVAGLKGALEAKAKADFIHERRMVRMRTSAEKLFQKSARRLAWRIGVVVALCTAVVAAAATATLPWASMFDRLISEINVLFEAL
jgi:hypothetical protein